MGGGAGADGFVGTPDLLQMGSGHDLGGLGRPVG